VRVIFRVIIGVLVLSSALGPCLGLDIVTSGRARSVIVVDAQPTRAAALAARELQHTLAKITGASIPIQKTKADGETVHIFIGESSHTKTLGLAVEDLPWDGYRMVSGDKWLALLGRDHKGARLWLQYGYPDSYYNTKLGIGQYGQTGTLYAVYRFLEKFCGVRWYMPGELGEVIPRRKDIRVESGLDVRNAPDFEYRQINFGTWLGRSDELALWYRRLGFGAPYKADVNHSFWRFRNRHKKTHMEYYALVNGKRDYDITGLGCGNLCLSEPGVLKAWIDDLNTYFKDPYMRCYPVVPNDTFQKRICDCPKCQSLVDTSMGEDGMHSDYTWGFINKVAEGVYPTHPDRLVGCLAGYVSYGRVPKHVTFSPNVAAVMHRFTPRYWNDAYKAKQNAMLEAWRRAVRHVYVWNVYWWAAEWDTLCGRPLLFAHDLSDDLKYLKSKCKGMTIYAITRRSSVRSKQGRGLHHPGLCHLSFYLTGKLLWDADRNVNELLEQYYTEFYGPAREPMKAFWELAEKTWATDHPRRKLGYPRTAGVVYTRDVMNGFRSFAKDALAKTAPGTVYRKRVELILSELLPEVRIPSVTSIRCETPPRLDGILDDTCWKNRKSLAFVDGQGKKTHKGTTGYVTWDAENLYLAFAVDNAESVKPAALCKTRDSNVFRDDSLEIFIAPDQQDRSTYFHFAVNSLGTVWDGCHGSAKVAKAGAWNSAAVAKAKMGNGQWVLEISVPLKDIGLAAPEGTVVAVNFIRNKKVGQTTQFSYWSPTLSGSHHVPQRFGLLTLRRK